MTTEATEIREEHRTALARLAVDAVIAVAACAERDLDRHAAEFGISDAKLEVLEVLSCCSGRRACLFSLGDRLGVTRPNVTKLVDGLERQGLVTRIPHPVDRRMVQAQLTAEGAAVAAQALPGRVALMERAWASLDDDELEHLVWMLRRAAAELVDARPQAKRRPADTAA
jgi:DNA-binding MarR family transcriptional regulator